MSEKPRVLVQYEMGEDGKPHGVWLGFNDAGRTALIKELSALSKDNDHTHLTDSEFGNEAEEVLLQSVPYKPTDILACHLKIMYRPDDWDREYYPHVFVEKQDGEY